MKKTIITILLSLFIIGSIGVFISPVFITKATMELKSVERHGDTAMAPPSPIATPWTQILSGITSVLGILGLIVNITGYKLRDLIERKNPKTT